jgi:hypothetical protein
MRNRQLSNPRTGISEIFRVMENQTSTRDAPANRNMGIFCKIIYKPDVPCRLKNVAQYSGLNRMWI